MYAAVEHDLKYSPHRDVNSGIPYGTTAFTYLCNFRYRKRVTSPDQFVPIWTCLPRPSRTVVAQHRDFQCFHLGLTPALAEFIKKYPSWVVNVIVSQFNSMLTSYSGTDLFSLLQGIGNTVRGYAGYASPIPFKEEHLRLGISASGGFSRGVGYLQKTYGTFSATKASIVTMLMNFLEKFIPFNVPDQVIDQQMFSPWFYHLYNPANPDSIKQQDGFGSNGVIGKTQSHGHVRSLQTLDKQRVRYVPFLLRYGYAGIMGEGIPDLDQQVWPFIQQGNNMDSRARFSPFVSSLNGVTSLFCLMVKAGERQKIMLAALTGGLDELELSKGSMELWEQAGIRELFGRCYENEYKRYREVYYAPVRNIHKSPIRTFENLTQQLFEYDTSNIGFDEIDEQAKLAIVKAGNLLNTIRSTSVYSSKLLETHYK